LFIENDSMIDVIALGGSARRRESEAGVDELIGKKTNLVLRPAAIGISGRWLMASDGGDGKRKR
jgi:hypothetical protein